MLNKNRANFSQVDAERAAIFEAGFKNTVSEYVAYIRREYSDTIVKGQPTPVPYNDPAVHAMELEWAGLPTEVARFFGKAIVKELATA